MNPAAITWQQINVSTKMACGARNPIMSNEGRTLWFDVTIRRGVKHKIEVALVNDEYDIKLHYIRGTNTRVQEEKTGIYVENLNETVYRLCNL